MSSNTTVLQISSTDVTEYIADSGYSIEFNDIDAPGAGRDMNGTMRRSLVTTKAKISVTCRTLNFTEANALYSVLNGDTFNVSYYSPGYDQIKTGRFYCSKSSFTMIQFTDWSSSDELFDNVKFDLIEV